VRGPRAPFIYNCEERNDEVISSVGPASCRSFVAPDSDPGSSLDSRVRGNDGGRDAHPTEDCLVPGDTGLAIVNDKLCPRENEYMLRHCRDMSAK
jgi:hypothetical protein